MKKPARFKWIIVAVVAAFTFAFLKGYVYLNVIAGNFNQDKQLAAAAVERFHALYNAGQYQTIYSEATPAFRTAGGPNAFAALMAQGKQRFGNEVSAVPIGANAISGGEVRFVYNAQFQKGAVIESFVWQSDGSKAALKWYRATPGHAKPSLKYRP
jgi:hypothetical protein